MGEEYVMLRSWRGSAAEVLVFPRGEAGNALAVLGLGLGLGRGWGGERGVSGGESTWGRSAGGAARGGAGWGRFAGTSAALFGMR